MQLAWEILHGLDRENVWTVGTEKNGHSDSLLPSFSIPTLRHFMKRQA